MENTRRGVYVSIDGISGAGKGSVIAACMKKLAEKSLRAEIVRDNQIDPLRDVGALILPWCKIHGFNRNALLLPLFAAGASIAEERIKNLLSKSDILLRDRSFITSLAYTPASCDISAETVWDLYVNHLKISVPNLAVIVDVDVDTSMRRIAEDSARRQRDSGLGGKMSGDRGHRERIRNAFLDMPRLFGERLNVLVVDNGGDWIDDAETLQRRLNSVADIVVDRISAILEKGVSDGE